MERAEKQVILLQVSRVENLPILTLSVGVGVTAVVCFFVDAATKAKY